MQYPKRQVGLRRDSGESSHLPLKINTSGVIPPIFASSILLMPITIISFMAGQGPSWLWQCAFISDTGSRYLIIYVSLIVFFAFFYTAVVFNPTETADNLKKYGGFHPGSGLAVTPPSISTAC